MLAVTESGPGFSFRPPLLLCPVPVLRRYGVTRHFGKYGGLLLTPITKLTSAPNSVSRPWSTAETWPTSLENLIRILLNKIRRSFTAKNAPCWNRTNNPVIKSVWLAPISVTRYELLWAVDWLLDKLLEPLYHLRHRHERSKRSRDEPKKWLRNEKS